MMAKHAAMLKIGNPARAAGYAARKLLSNKARQSGGNLLKGTSGQTFGQMASSGAMTSGMMPSGMAAGQTTGSRIGEALKGASKFTLGTLGTMAIWTAGQPVFEWIGNKLRGNQEEQAVNQEQAQKLQQQQQQQQRQLAPNQQVAGIPPDVNPDDIWQLVGIHPYQLNQLRALLMQMTPEMRYQMPQPPRPTLHDQPFVTYM
jgi:hypothetical protein